MKFAIKLCLASLVSVAFLWLTFRDIDPAQLWHTLARVRPWYVFGYLLALFGTQLARAARWQLLVAPVVALSAREAWRMSNVGNMFIMLLPLRLGELTRPYLLQRRAHAPLATGVGAALVERVLDGLLVTLLFFVTTSLVEHRYPAPPALRAGAYVALVIFAGASVVILLAVLMQRQLLALLRATLGRVSPALAERLGELVTTFVTGMRALPNARAVAGVCGHTLIYWLCNGLGMVSLIHAFGWQLPWLAGFTVVCVLVIGVMIPAGPGLLGTYQAAIIAGLSTYGVERNAAAALSVVGYLGTLAVIVGCGVPHLMGKNWAREVDALMHADESMG